MSEFEISFMQGDKRISGAQFAALSRQLVDSQSNRTTHFGGVARHGNAGRFVLSIGSSNEREGVMTVQSDEGPATGGVRVVESAFPGAATSIRPGRMPHLTIQFPTNAKV